MNQGLIQFLCVCVSRMMRYRLERSPNGNLLEGWDTTPPRVILQDPQNGITSPLSCDGSSIEVFVNTFSTGLCSGESD